MGRTFERAIRRSGIPIAYTEGFHPHQKVAFGPPLPLGFVSDSEYLDLQLIEPFTSALLPRLNQALPPGFKFAEGRPILGKSDSLSSIINMAWYEVSLNIPCHQAERLIESVMASSSLPVKRMSKETIKEVDARRHILKLECTAFGDRTLLGMHLGLGTDGYARPEEILVHGFALEQKEVAGLLVKRTGLFVRKAGLTLAPMEVV